MVIDVLVEDRFKGPMDLLLYLIKRDEVDIHDIPISQVTGEYLKAISEMESVDVEVGAEFINMASILMEIKSRMMLPPEELANDEETIELDPRADLVQALLEYKRFKEAADGLGNLLEVHQARFPRIGKTLEPEVEPKEEMIDAELDQLYFAFLKLMDEISLEGADIIENTEISTEEVIGVILGRLTNNKRLLFSQVFEKVTTRYELVVYFIAMLELIRMQQVTAFQKNDFGDIYLEKNNAVIKALPNQPSREQKEHKEQQGQETATPIKGGRILHLPSNFKRQEPTLVNKTAAQFLPVILSHRIRVRASDSSKKTKPLFSNAGGECGFLALQPAGRDSGSYLPQGSPFL